MKTRLLIQYEREVDGRWIAEIEALPGCLAYGASQEEARREVIALALHTLADRVAHGEWAADLPAVSFADAA